MEKKYIYGIMNINDALEMGSGTWLLSPTVYNL